MKRSGFARKVPLTEAQRRIKKEHAEAKVRLKEMRLGGKPKKNSIKCWEDGIKFDSIWERQCYRELKLRLAAGEITDLQTHVSFALVVNGKHICYIIPDFVYHDRTIGRWVIADAKQPKHDKKSNRRLDREGWKDKWELLQALYPDYQYEVFRMHSGWREYRECGGNKI